MGPAISIGVSDWDKAAGELSSGTVWVLAGRVAMGSSSLAMNVVQKITDSKIPVAVFSLDWSQDQYLGRMACLMGRLSFGKLELGYLGIEERQRYEQVRQRVSNLPLVVEDDLRSIDSIVKRAAEVKNEHDTQLIVIDKFQLIESDRSATEIAQAIKELGRRLGVAIVVLAEVHRRVDEDASRNGVPSIEDVLYPCNPEYVDSVGLLYRPCKYLTHPEADDEYLAILNVANLRSGSTEEVRFGFAEKCLHFICRHREGRAGSISI